MYVCMFAAYWSWEHEIMGVGAGSFVSGAKKLVSIWFSLIKRERMRRLKGVVQSF